MPHHEKYEVRVADVAVEKLIKVTNVRDGHTIVGLATDRTKRRAHVAKGDGWFQNAVQ